MSPRWVCPVCASPCPDARWWTLFPMGRKPARVLRPVLTPIRVAIIVGVLLSLRAAPGVTQAATEFSVAWAPLSGPPGTVVSITGRCVYQGYPGEYVKTHLVDNSTNEVTATVDTPVNSDGTFNGALEVPVTERPGPHRLGSSCFLDDFAVDGFHGSQFEVTTPPTPTTTTSVRVTEPSAPSTTAVEAPTASTTTAAAATVTSQPAASTTSTTDAPGRREGARSRGALFVVPLFGAVVGAVAALVRRSRERHVPGG